MFKQFKTITFVVLVGSLLLAACSPAAPAPEQVEVTVMVEGKPETIIITATPEPVEEKMAPGSVTLSGAGATFPLPVYSDWTYAYQFVDPSVIITYNGIGSGGGKAGIIDRTIDFAGTDSLISKEEYETGGDLQLLPVLAGAVVPIYNVTSLEKDAEGKSQALKGLVLDGETLANIFMGNVQYWDDAAIQDLNPDLVGKLPNQRITVVHRSDKSGTTEIFTKGLSAFSQEWKDSFGGSSSIEWNDEATNGIGGKGNMGVAAAVQATPNSIGYVELSYAKENKITFADMINVEGKRVQANAESLQSAMAAFADAFDENLGANIVNAPGEASWPIVGYTYIIIRLESMTDCVQAQKLLEYINWTLTETAPAARAAELGYATIPGPVLEKVQAKLNAVTCNGEPVLK